MHGEKVCKNEVCKLFALRDGTVTWSMLEISSEKKTIEKIQSNTIWDICPVKSINLMKIVKYW